MNEYTRGEENLAGTLRRKWVNNIRLNSLKLGVERDWMMKAVDKKKSRVSVVAVISS